MRQLTEVRWPIRFSRDKVLKLDLVPFELIWWLERAVFQLEIPKLAFVVKWLVGQVYRCISEGQRFCSGE